MDIVGGAKRVITRTADATSAAAGALGGAAVGGVIGGLQGTASGIRNGLSSGSQSTPAAVLTLGALGAAGLVEWPVLLVIGGTALIVHRISARSDAEPAAAPAASLRAVDGGTNPRGGTGGRGSRTAPRKAAARKSAPRRASATPARTRTRKAAAPRRTRSSS